MEAVVSIMRTSTVLEDGGTGKIGEAIVANGSNGTGLWRGKGEEQDRRRWHLKRENYS